MKIIYSETWSDNKRNDWGVSILAFGNSWHGYRKSAWICVLNFILGIAWKSN